MAEGSNRSGDRVAGSPRERFFTVAGPSHAELREQGSVFLACSEPVADEAAVDLQLQELVRAHADATHVCWAARTGWPPRERCSDAGEPRGTAGQPILRVLRGAGLSNVLVAVVRWFGGTKLGKGGLARAYAEVTRRALQDASRLERIPLVLLELECGYEAWGAVQRFVHPPEVSLRASQYLDRARITLAVAEPALAGLCEQLRGLGIEPKIGREPEHRDLVVRS